MEQAQESAATRVLLLPELLAGVLCHLPFESIVRSRRVCQAWKASIDTDPIMLWHTWRSPHSPASITKTTRRPVKTAQSSEEEILEDEVVYESFEAFFSRTLINTSELVLPMPALARRLSVSSANGSTDAARPVPIFFASRDIQRQFIKNSLRTFISLQADNLKQYYITRPPIEKLESSIRTITTGTGSGRASLMTSFDKGFTVFCKGGITVDVYLRAVLGCLETSWTGSAEIDLAALLESTINRPASPTTNNGIPRGLGFGPSSGSAIADDDDEEDDMPEVVRKHHRLETQLLTMKKESIVRNDGDEEEIGDGQEDYERAGVISSTLVINLTVMDAVDSARGLGPMMVKKERTKSWWSLLNPLGYVW